MEDSSMEARRRMLQMGLASLVYLGLALGQPFLSVAEARQPRTQNFIVDAQDPQFAVQVAQAAEKYRKELALQWLGQELPPWREPCPIRVIIEPQAHGATSFRFSGPTGETGQPFDWHMEVYGSPERILDSVLPHEVTHTIFASFFQQRLPRWLDEGACSSVEHISEIRKQEHNLLVFLTTGKGIPFNQMFRMMEYPRDMLPLYAQGFSVVRFLLEMDDRQHFVGFVKVGLQTQDWDQAILRHYGFKDLSDLQVTWNKWVGEGSPSLATDTTIASQFNPRMRDQFVSATATPNSEGANLALAMNDTGNQVIRTNPNDRASLNPPSKPAPAGAVGQLQARDSNWADNPYFQKSRGTAMKVDYSEGPSADARGVSRLPERIVGPQNSGTVLR